jgi:hypothetical protein
MRELEPTCYGFGSCSRTHDNPFELSRTDRQKNRTAFSDFAFVVAMENTERPGYVTEKIGNAFCSGAVPIYAGDANDFFNTAAFLNVRDYASPSAAAEAAVHIWHDRQKLQKFIDAPLTLNTRLRDYESVYSDYRPWQKPMVDFLREEFPDLS